MFEIDTFTAVAGYLAVGITQAVAGLLVYGPPAQRWRLPLFVLFWPLLMFVMAHDLHEYRLIVKSYLKQDSEPTEAKTQTV